MELHRVVLALGAEVVRGNQELGAVEVDDLALGLLPVRQNRFEVRLSVMSQSAVSVVYSRSAVMPSSIESDFVCHFPTWPGPKLTSGMSAVR